MYQVIRKLTVLASLLAVTSILTAQDFTVREYRPSAAFTQFTNALDTVTTPASQVSVAQEFQEKYPEDVTVQMFASNVLALNDLDATRTYYQNLADKEPDNVAANYAAGRLTDQASERRTYAERILANDPKNYWGNLLMANSLMRADDPNFDQAESLLRKAIATNNSLPYAVEDLGKLLQAKGRTDEADQVFVKLGQMLPDKFAPVRYRIALIAGDHEKSMKLIDDFLKKNPDNTDALNTRAAGMREMSNWDGYVATMQKLVQVDRTGNSAYNLACAFSLDGKPDSAYAWLFTAADLGFNDVEQYKNDDDLIPLRDDARWDKLLTRVEESQKQELAEYMKEMARTAPQRHEEAIKQRGTDMATDFELSDLNGKKVKLSSLRGKVVILDFWATWCGPCRRTMPLLDKFYTDDRPKDVEVFGVDVWQREKTEEQKKAAVTDYIKKFGYHFPILYGDSDLANAYGVRGIPTLVIIDKDGKVAYRHIGYDPTLTEQLTWQTQELLK